MFEVLTLEEVKPIREIIYTQLRGAIIAGTIKDRERLIESELALRLKVSRTPVREAIRMLESEGLVESLPRRGVIVKGMNIEAIVEIYKIRQALEVMAFKSAAEQITNAELAQARRHLMESQIHLEEKNYEAYYTDNECFTDVFVEASRMPRAIQLIASYREQLRSYRKVTLSDSVRRLQVVKQHGEILNAVENREAALVAELVFAHIDGALEVCRRQQMQKRSGGDVAVAANAV